MKFKVLLLNPQVKQEGQSFVRQVKSSWFSGREHAISAWPDTGIFMGQEWAGDGRLGVDTALVMTSYSPPVLIPQHVKKNHQQNSCDLKDRQIGEVG